MAEETVSIINPNRLIPDDLKKSELVSFYLTPVQHDQLREVSSSIGARANDYARMILLNKLAEISFKPTMNLEGTPQ